MSSSLPPGLYEGVISAVNPNQRSVDVTIEVGEEIQEFSLPIMTPALGPHLRDGAVYVPKIGATSIVAITNTGRMFIQGFLPDFSDRDDPLSSRGELAKAQPGAELSRVGQETLSEDYAFRDPVYGKMGSESYRAGMPAELIPGDWAQYGTDGNMLAVLEGGTTVVKASDTAQIQLHKARDLVQIVARRFELLTDFGELSFSSDQGKTRFRLRGSASAEKSSPTNFTPDCFLEFGTGEGAEYLKIGTSDVYLEFKDGDITRGGEHVGRKFSRGSTSTPESTVIDGENRTNLGSKTESIAGDLKLDVSGSLSMTSSSEMVINSVGSMALECDAHSLSVVGAYSASVGGYTTPLSDGLPTPGVAAYNIEVAKGDFLLEVGESLIKGVSASPISIPFAPSARINAYNGDIRLRCIGSGGIVLSAQTPPSLVGSGAGPQYGVTIDSPKVFIGSLVPVATKHPLLDIPSATPIPATLSIPLLTWMSKVTEAIVAVNSALVVANTGIAAGLVVSSAGPAAPGIASAASAVTTANTALTAAMATASVTIPSKLVDFGG